MNALNKFRKTVKYEDLTVKFMYDYEKFLLFEKSLSPTTIRIYISSLRSIVYDAIGAGIIPKGNNPFGSMKSHKFPVRISRNYSIALDPKEIFKIINYVSCDEREEKARDLWLFMFYANGMNISDITRLKYKDIKGGFFTFYRFKTKCTSRVQREIKVVITPQIQRIFERWGSEIKTPNNHVFPFINWSLPAEQSHKQLKHFVRWVNKYIQVVGENAGIKTRLTTSTARHSYGTVLIHNGVSPLYVSRSMGHTSLETVQSYIADFPEKQAKKYADFISSCIFLNEG